MHKVLFLKSLLNLKIGDIGLIAEIKLASPSEGILGTADDISTRVRQYEQSGADAISIVTEKYFFHGETEFVGRIKKEVSLPVLQKDFVTDKLKIYESKLAGADAILLIAKLLTESELVELVRLSQSLGLEPVVEINNELDLKKALKTNTKIIASNARDLDTFEVNVDRACELLKKVPEKYIKLGFSGIHSRFEVEKYKQAGAKAVLVGIELMKTNDIDKFIRELKNAS